MAQVKLPSAEALYKRTMRHLKKLGVETDMGDEWMERWMKKVWHWQTLAYAPGRETAYVLSPFHSDMPMTAWNAIPLSQKEAKAREQGLLDISASLAERIQDTLDDIYSIGERKPVPYVPQRTPDEKLDLGKDIERIEAFKRGVREGRVRLGAPFFHFMQVPHPHGGIAHFFITE